MNHEELLKAIGSKLSKEQLGIILEKCDAGKFSPLNTLLYLAEKESEERSRRNYTRRMRAATLGNPIEMEGFDWDHPKHIDKNLVISLFDLKFIENGENILIRGPCGLGKTTIAQNLARRALTNGFKVKFTTIAGMLTDIIRQDGVIAKERRLSTYSKTDLLILDELGYVPHGAQGSDYFFQIISARHEIKSTIITTNLAFARWGEPFDNAASINATVDRFVQHCHIVDVDGSSYRQKQSQLKELAAKKKNNSAAK